MGLNLSKHLTFFSGDVPESGKHFPKHLVKYVVSHFEDRHFLLKYTAPDSNTVFQLHSQRYGRGGGGGGA